MLKTLVLVWRGAGLVSTASRATGGIQATATASLPMPRHHHIHLDSVDPARSIDWHAN